jgi:hypothetical protein
MRANHKILLLFIYKKVIFNEKKISAVCHLSTNLINRMTLLTFNQKSSFFQVKVFLILMSVPLFLELSGWFPSGKLHTNFWLLFTFEVQFFLFWLVDLVFQIFFQDFESSSQIPSGSSHTSFWLFSLETYFFCVLIMLWSWTIGKPQAVFWWKVFLLLLDTFFYNEKRTTFSS